MPEPLYRRIATHFEQSIANGTCRPGERLPSIRAVRKQFRVSIATVVQAFVWLEDRGFVEARRRSGFYARARQEDLPPEPTPVRAPTATPRWTGMNAIVAHMVKAAADSRLVPLGAGAPSSALFPLARLNRLVARIAREQPTIAGTMFLPPGASELRRQIARRGTAMGLKMTADDIVITSGAMEALNLAIRAVAKPGDVIAVESPTYFGVLQVIESLGMRVLELPVRPNVGVDPDRLEHAARRHAVKACIVMTNCHNPMGFVAQDASKRALVEVANRCDIAIIEDDVYGDLAFSSVRPRPAKAFDTQGRILLVSSFSKTLAPGLRVGWIQPGRYQTPVEQLQFINTVCAPSLSQLLVARMLESGGYDRQLRRLRDTFSSHVHVMSREIARRFPRGTRVSRPAGGYVLWVQLPGSANAEAVRRRALAAGISVIPGNVFSTSGKFRDHLRVSCGAPWSPAIARAVVTLGRICSDVARA